MNRIITGGGGSISVRRAVARDAKRLTRLVRGSRAYEGQYAAMVAGYRVGPDYIETHRVFVAVAAGGAKAAKGADRGNGRVAGGESGGSDGSDGQVLGFYSLVLAPPELDLMFVADQAQGRGVGRLLVAHMKSEARATGLDRVRVVSHPPAEGFYRSVGAVHVGTASATPPAVVWDRPELEFHIHRHTDPE